MKKFTFFLFVGIIFMVLTNTSFGQNARELSLSADEGISLPVGSSLSGDFFIDISNHNYTKEEAVQATTYLSEKSSWVNMELKYEDRKILVRLNTEAPETQGWGESQWQNELKNIK